MSLNLLIERIDDDGKQTIGRLYVLDGNDSVEYDCPTLELPWKNNQQNISCIPKGEYPVVRHVSPKFGECFWVQDVPNRSEILIHTGNYFSDILGCILPGTDMADINGDGHIDVTSSRKALGKLLKVMPDKFTITIK